MKKIALTYFNIMYSLVETFFSYANYYLLLAFSTILLLQVFDY